jgi:hypothetical protein
MLLALAATVAIVVQDATPLRSAPRPRATELTTLWQGELVEIRDERAGYLRVYDYHRERGGFLKAEAVRVIGLTEADAPALLTLVRFLRDSAGSEPLGISYAAAYLKAVPARDLTAEPLDAIGRMAERLADAASGSGAKRPRVAAYLDVVQQFGIQMRSFERDGRMQTCYDGEMFRRVLSAPRADAAQRARAALALTRADCIDPGLAIAVRASWDEERAKLLDQLDERPLSPMLRARLHARRAAVWSSVAYARVRSDQPPGAAARRALAELLALHPEDLGEERRSEYLDALLRVGAIRWAAAQAAPDLEPLILKTERGTPGQTCVALAETTRPAALLVRRCTYGVVWTASAHTIARGRALVLAVQMLESWRELWVFHSGATGWTVSVVSPGTEDPEEGYVEFAGFAPRTERLLVAREVKARGQFRRRFEELRLTDLVPLKQASSPELLADFGLWSDAGWRRDTLALH